MKKSRVVLAFFLMVMTLVACKKDCSSPTLNVVNLEDEYGCENTASGMEIDLSEDFIIIKNQTTFEDFVTGNCLPEIDFSTYDLVIGKKGLSSGLISIEYELVGNCDAENNDLELTVTFNQNALTVAPNVTYHALVPKLESGQGVRIDFQIVQ